MRVLSLGQADELGVNHMPIHLVNALVTLIGGHVLCTHIMVLDPDVEIGLFVCASGRRVHIGKGMCPAVVVP